MSIWLTDIGSTLQAGSNRGKRERERGEGRYFMIIYHVSLTPPFTLTSLLPFHSAFVSPNSSSYSTLPQCSESSVPPFRHHSQNSFTLSQIHSIHFIPFTPFNSFVSFHFTLKWCNSIASLLVYLPPVPKHLFSLTTYGTFWESETKSHIETHFNSLFKSAFSFCFFSSRYSLRPCFARHSIPSLFIQRY